MLNAKKFTGLAAGVLLLVPALAFAQASGYGNRQFTPPAATGTVSAISGNSITLNGTNSTVYTVDATSAQIAKFAMPSGGGKPTNTTVAVTDIQVGDTLRVFGTASGTNIVATRIIDGAMPQGGMKGGMFDGQKNGRQHNATTTPQTNLTPKVRSTSTVGTVNSVSGTILTITDKNGTVYTVDASGKLKLARRPGTTMQISDIQVGDSVTVMGVVSGTSITATSIRDSSLEARTAAYSGSVTTVNGTSFTLQTKAHGTVTVNTDGNTVFNKNGKADSITSLVSGLNVSVSGSLDTATNILTATKVNMIIRMLSVRFTGSVQSVSGNSLIVVSGSNTYTVDVVSAKIYDKNGHAAAVTMVQSNDSVTVSGKHQPASNNVTAASVRDSSQAYQ